ncbi:MAG: HDOD domain-containing protein [Nibricoccus sp.]
MLQTNIPLEKRLTVEEVASGLEFLPSAPRVLPQLYTLLRSGDPTLQQVSALLRLDPGLMARVLKMGNRFSAARGEHCLSVEDAINGVGFNAIHEMVTQVADAQVFSRPLSLYGLDADECWRSSVACALAAEVLAERTGEDVSTAYTVGLLHGAGMVAIDEAIAAMEPTMIFAPREFPREFADAERALLGFTQAEVGAALLRLWNFPVTMIEPVRWQHTPLGSAGYARMACLLHAAKWLRAVVCADEGNDAPPMPPAILLQSLRMTPEKLARLVVEVRVKLGSVRNLVDFLAA